MSALDQLAASNLVASLPHLRRYARVLIGEAREADDLLAGTVELAKAAIPRGAARATLRVYLFGLMHELFLAHGPRLRPRPKAAPGNADLGSAGSAPSMPSGLLMQFQRLPVEEREVLLLVAVEGMGYDEIAQVLGVPLGAVVARLRRARELMRAGHPDGPGQHLQAGG